MATTRDQKLDDIELFLRTGARLCSSCQRPAYEPIAVAELLLCVTCWTMTAAVRGPMRSVFSYEAEQDAFLAHVEHTLVYERRQLRLEPYEDAFRRATGLTSLQSDVAQSLYDKTWRFSVNVDEKPLCREDIQKLFEVLG